MRRFALLLVSVALGVSFGLEVRIGVNAAAKVAHAECAERVLVDMVIHAEARVQEHQCFVTEPGVLSARVERIDGGAGRGPLIFELGPNRPVQGPISVGVTEVPATYSVYTEGGTYCYGFYNDAPIHPEQPPPRGYRQLVALRLVWGPPAP
jgi:hypothetical protein